MRSLATILFSCSFLVVGFGGGKSGVQPPACPVGPIMAFESGERSRCGEARGVLTSETLRGKSYESDRKGERKSSFHVDPKRPPESRSRRDDFFHSGYDIGHQAAAAWYGLQELKDRTFSFANTAPMHPKLNRGLWRVIENGIASEAESGATVWFRVTPLWLPDKDGDICFRTLGRHAVWVPTHFGASIYAERSDGSQLMRSWIVPNQAPPDKAKPADYLATVDEHEFWRGVDFFAWLDDDVERRLEASGRDVERSLEASGR